MKRALSSIKLKSLVWIFSSGITFSVPFLLLRVMGAEVTASIHYFYSAVSAAGLFGVVVYNVVVPSQSFPVGRSKISWKILSAVVVVALLNFEIGLFLIFALRIMLARSSRSSPAILRYGWAGCVLMAIIASFVYRNDVARAVIVCVFLFNIILILQVSHCEVVYPKIIFKRELFDIKKIGDLVRRSSLEIAIAALPLMIVSYVGHRFSGNDGRVFFSVYSALMFGGLFSMLIERKIMAKDGDVGIPIPITGLVSAICAVAWNYIFVTSDVVVSVLVFLVAFSAGFVTSSLSQLRLSEKSTNILLAAVVILSVFLLGLFGIFWFKLNVTSAILILMGIVNVSICLMPFVFLNKFRVKRI